MSEGEVEVIKGCNMWNVEGYLTDKLASNGRTFKFSYGDYLIYDLSGSSGGPGGPTPGTSAGSDYDSKGTH